MHNNLNEMNFSLRSITDHELNEFFVPRGGSRTQGFGFRALRSWCHVVQWSHHAWKNINQTLTHSSHVETDTGQQRGQERQVDSVTSAMARGPCEVLIEAANSQSSRSTSSLSADRFGQQREHRHRHQASATGI